MYLSSMAYQQPGRTATAIGGQTAPTVPLADKGKGKQVQDDVMDEDDEDDEEEEEEEDEDEEMAEVSCLVVIRRLGRCLGSLLAIGTHSCLNLTRPTRAGG